MSIDLAKLIKALKNLEVKGPEIEKPEEIVFVNYEPANCGCRVKYSNGRGEYSDSITIYPCDKHSAKKK